MITKYADLFLNFMLDFGYFSILEKNVYKKGKVIFNITIPNTEIKSEIMSRLHSLSFLEEKCIVSDSDINSYVQSIITLGKQNTTYYEFGKSILNLFRRKCMPKNERQLQNPVVAFPWYCDEKFLRVEGEFLTGEGKFIDLLIIRKGFAGIIIELKNKDSTSYEAFDQIVKINSTYYDVFDRNKDMKIQTRIFVGFFLNSQGKCSLSCLYNNINISRAVSLNISDSKKNINNS